MSKGLFITATNTDMGKTYATGLIVKKLRDAGYNAGYYKAALSGAEYINGKLVPGDADYVKKVAGLDSSYDEMVSYIYETAVSPHLASQIEGNPVELSKVTADYRAAQRKFDYVTVEGSGGIVCPIRWDDKEKILLEDIVKALKLPVLIISNAVLGSINTTVLTVEYCRSKNIEVKGILLNDFNPDDRMQKDNKYMIEKLSGVKVIGEIRHGDKELKVDPETLASLYE